MKNRYVIGLATLGVAAILAGCTPDARQDVSQAGDNVASATKKSADATVDVAKQAGQEVKEGAQNAGAAIDTGAKKAGDAITTGAAKTVDAAKEGGRMAGEAVGGVGKAVAGAGDKLELTPKIKAALIADKTIDASSLNVDTMADTKTIVIKGSVSSADKKNLVTQVAQKALADTNEGKAGYKIKNEVTVGPPGPKM